MEPLDPQSPVPSGQPPLSSSGGTDTPPPPPYGGPPPTAPYGGLPQPPSYQYGVAPVQIPGADKKLPAALCGILLGSLGVHKFILGYTNEGIIMLLVTLIGSWFTCGLTGGAMGVIGIIEGILYLTKTDQQFVQEYINNKKGWF